MENLIRDENQEAETETEEEKEEKKEAEESETAEATAAAAAAAEAESSLATFASLQQLNVDDEIEAVAAAAEYSNKEEKEKEYEEDTDGVPLEQDPEWCNRSKHVFILSEAGKPIYSLNGNEVKLITFMGLMQALVSIIECDNENVLNYVIAGEHKIVFLHRSHLIFVNVSKEPQKTVQQLELELNYVYNQIISVTTLTLVEKIFSKHHNYDLRNKLTGTEKLLTNIISRFNHDYSMFLNCVNSFPMQQDMREQIARMIVVNINPLKYVLFGLLLYDNRLVTLIRPKAKNINPVDIHLLVNVITGLDTPKTADFTWYPICLPHFDSSGIMYAYISHLDSQCNSCLILLTGLCDQEQSTELDECRKRIQQKLLSMNFLNNNNNNNSLAASPTAASFYKLEQIGISELKHFLFKDNKIFQFFVSDFALPYTHDPEQKQRIFNTYQRLYHKLHNASFSLRIIYCQQSTETILGWMTSDFEIYSTFSPLVTKEIAISAVNKVLNEFIRKYKSELFLNSMPTLSR